MVIYFKEGYFDQKIIKAVHYSGSNYGNNIYTFRELW